jgi:membrane-associated protease RseP (regulator of RpoE activity)
VAFRVAVRRALAAPLGLPPGRLFGAAAVTAIVADARGDERDALALAEVVAALAAVGVPRGRQFVLLAGAQGDDPACAAYAARLRASLGLAVLLPAGAGAAFSPGRFADGSAQRIDDELREAEEVVLVGPFSADVHLGLRGGAALLWPGLAPAADARAWATALAGLPAEARAAAALARTREVLALVPVRFALLWSGDDPARVRAGEAPAVFEACAADGWLGAC